MFSALWLGTPTTNPITKEMFPDFSQEAKTTALLAPNAPNAPKKSDAAERETRAVEEGTSAAEKETRAVEDEASAVEVPMVPAPAQSSAPTAQSVTTPRAPRHPVSDCSAFSRSGEYSRALDCFGEHAQGEGTSAELALLERSRLLFHGLRDTEGALSELDVYFSRFSSGALRREAGLFRIDRLGRVGDGRAARSAIQALLPEVPEQEAELLSKWLELALADGDCAEAAEVGARLSTLGKRNKQLERLLSACE